jgi:hypothetical protein
VRAAAGKVPLLLGQVQKGFIEEKGKMKINFDDEDRKDLEEYTEKVAKQMGESAICLTLFTEKYSRDPAALIQFALAIMMDKPIYLNVEKGTNVPERVRRLADGIEYFSDPLDAMESTKRLLAQAMQANKGGRL